MTSLVMYPMIYLLTCDQKSIQLWVSDIPYSCSYKGSAYLYIDSFGIYRNMYHYLNGSYMLHRKSLAAWCTIG
jgi:hypothetical protein